MRFAWGVLAAFVLRRFTAVTFGSIGWPLRVFGIIGLSIAIRVTWLARLRATVLALLLIPGPRFLSLGRLDHPAVGDSVVHSPLLRARLGVGLDVLLVSAGRRQ